MSEDVLSSDTINKDAIDTVKKKFPIELNHYTAFKHGKLFCNSNSNKVIYLLQFQNANYAIDVFRCHVTVESQLQRSHNSNAIRFYCNEMTIELLIKMIEP